MKLYTIGFTQKSAQEFFERLRDNGVQQLIDIRIHPNGQLSGFARQEDLPYFLHELAVRCQYLYLPVLAPTEEMMKDYRKGVSIKNPLSAFGSTLPSGQSNGNAALSVRRWGATGLPYGTFHPARSSVWLPRSHPLT
jgi:hypothetical protein